MCLQKELWGHAKNIFLIICCLEKVLYFVEDPRILELVGNQVGKKNWSFQISYSLFQFLQFAVMGLMCF